MEDVVPGALQRLRETDIITLAGLTGASLGQEYCRIGAVHSTKRQGARLTGIVDVPAMTHRETTSPSIPPYQSEQVGTEPGHYLVEVEAQERSSWTATCTCLRHPAHLPLCPHAAALLYQWLAHPADFLTPSPSSPPYQTSSSAASVSSLRNEGAELQVREPKGRVSLLSKQAQASGQSTNTPPFRGATPPGNLDETLALLGLSELRNIAREYDITTNGMSKQQLFETLSEALKQPETIRRAVATLEKPQRQLLAALTLAGGSVSDDDLRGLFERFSLGTPSQLQGMLAALQSKALVFHTSVSSSLQQRLGLGGSLFDVGWQVPAEVRSALHVTLPITPFDVEARPDRESGIPHIQHIEPYSLLADLLLVARALNGYRFESEDIHNERRPGASLVNGQSINAPSADGSIAIPPPVGLPSTSLLESLQTLVPRAPSFLRFAIRLLRLADILYKDDTKQPYLHVLPNAARLLLGSTRAEVARELFTQWLTQATYEELFDLQAEGLYLRCRATPLYQPALRPGELETENSEARQALVALLAQAPLNQWINFSAFARFVYRLNPTFLQKRQRLFSTPHWWIELEEERPLRPTLLNDWLRAEGRYLAQLLQGPLHWWGAIDLATSSDGRLLAFRLTPIAGLLFNGTTFDQHPQEQQDRHSAPSLEISPSGDILIACTSTAWPLIELLENFAEEAGVFGGRLRYRLTPQSLSTALSRGLHPTNLLENLRHSLQPQNVGATLAVDRESSSTRESSLALESSPQVSSLVPDSSSAQDFLTTLERRVANYGRVRLYTDTSLLEVADTQVKRELSATTSLDDQVVRTLSPSLFILKKQGTERLLEDLKRRNQAPLLHEEESHGTE